MIEDDLNAAGPERQINQLFGYRAEALKDRLFDLFTEPSYFPELETSQACMLVGGRGTGKTTVLRALSYEGQYALRGRDKKAITTWPYYGLFYRVNTNRVTAFQGEELSKAEWILLFAHYFNMVMCDLALKFMEWFQLHEPDAQKLSERSCRKVAASLHLPDVTTPHELSDCLEIQRIRFEAYINNVVDGPRPLLSMQSAPIDTLFEAMKDLPQFRGKNFFFLIDEYENFQPYQQRVVNTLIKHAGELYTFKIGVKELGLKRRATLNEAEQLYSPADYSEINIAEKLKGEFFKRFALTVCNERLSQITVNGAEIIRDFRVALPGLPEDDEAIMLGVSKKVAAMKRDLRRRVTPEELAVVDEMPPLQAYLIYFWAKGSGRPIDVELRDFLSNRGEWETRYGNYKHALLFTLKRRKPGLRKYYAGWDVFTQLTGNNIRYILELAVQSLLLHLQRGASLSEPVPPEVQTEAAQAIGKKNLLQLEGLSVHGAYLTKLILGLGRIFETMAADAFGHSPEVTQFYLSDTTIPSEVKQLLESAVMHSALLRSPGNKLTASNDTREFDYSVHPIFSAFFVFSYRRKRKMALTSDDLLGLVKSHRKTIKDVLARTQRDDSLPLPDQLKLFGMYYHGS
jgi:hypothetical protein